MPDANVGPKFFFATKPSTAFVSVVPKLGVTVKDIFGNASERVVVPAVNKPARAAGQSCDVNGFDSCAPGNICAPGLADVTNMCAVIGTHRNAKCNAGAGLDPAKGITKAFGRTAGSSVWDAPTGCVGAEIANMPESVVRLQLTKPAATLTVTTALPETDHDTAVFVLSGCAESSATALGCNDDTQGYSSSVTLKNVPAGLYMIVIESVQMRGGQWGVSVDVK